MEDAIKEVKLQKATIRLLRPKIIELVIDDYNTWEVEDAKEAKAANKKLSGGQPYAVLVDSGMFTTITKEAREFIASKEYSELTIAKALYVRSLGHRLVGNIYLKVNKPKVKTKIFDSRDEAIAWLEKEIK